MIIFIFCLAYHVQWLTMEGSLSSSGIPHDRCTDPRLVAGYLGAVSWLHSGVYQSLCTAALVTGAARAVWRLYPGSQSGHVGGHLGAGWGAIGVWPLV